MLDVTGPIRNLPGKYYWEALGADGWHRLTDSESLLTEHAWWQERRVAELEAEVGRLREAVQAAFREGFASGTSCCIRGNYIPATDPWDTSAASTALEGTE